MGKINGGYGMIDDLTYNYTGNRLTSMTEQIAGNHEIDFVPRGNGTYTYYDDGSLKSDANEGIIEIIYDSYLKQPKSLQLTDNRLINHYYAGDGALMKTVYTQNGAIVETWDYASGLVYKNAVPFSLNPAEGRAIYDQPTHNWAYEYNYTDHIGNVRSSFKSENGTLLKTAETDYDPLNVILKNSQQLNTISQRFQVQGKESELTFGLNRINFGARTYNATIGRWDGVDLLAAQNALNSVYALQENKFGLGVELEGHSSSKLSIISLSSLAFRSSFSPLSYMVSR
jgi:hypothetical protein